jgi:hypothetical protein
MQGLPDNLNVDQLQSLSHAVATAAAGASNGRTFIYYDRADGQFLSNTTDQTLGKTDTAVRVPLDELSRMVENSSSQNLAKAKIDVKTFKENIKCIGDQTLSELEQVCTTLTQHPKKKLSVSPDGQFHLVHRATLLIKAAVGTSEQSVHAVDTLLSAAKEVAETANSDHSSASQLLRHINSNPWLSKVLAHQPQLEEKVNSIQQTLRIQALAQGTVQQQKLLQDFKKIEGEIKVAVLPALAFLNKVQDSIGTSDSMEIHTVQAEIKKQTPSSIDATGIDHRKLQFVKSIKTSLINQEITKRQATLLLSKLLLYPSCEYITEKANQIKALCMQSNLQTTIANPKISEEDKEKYSAILEGLQTWLHTDQMLQEDESARTQKLKNEVRPELNLLDLDSHRAL